MSFANLAHMNQLLEDAQALQELFSDPNKWIKQELFSTDENGNDCCYCLLGGIDKVTGAIDPEHYVLPYHMRSSIRARVGMLEHAVESVITEAGDDCYSGIADWNDADERTIEDVQRVINQVVERARL